MRNKIKVNQKVRAESNVLILHKNQTKWFVNSYQIKCMRVLGVLCGLYMMVGVRGGGGGEGDGGNFWQIRKINKRTSKPLFQQEKLPTNSNWRILTENAKLKYWHWQIKLNVYIQYDTGTYALTLLSYKYLH